MYIYLAHAVLNANAANTDIHSILQYKTQALFKRLFKISHEASLQTSTLITILNKHGLHYLPESVRGLPGCSGFLPQSKDMRFQNEGMGN